MNTQSRRRSRLAQAGAAVGAGALVAAMAGTGALSTLYTSITGNEFRAVVPGPERPDGASLVISGDPIDKTFDSTVYNDQVQATWTLENRGPHAAEFDGTFRLGDDVSPDLAAALTVQYGVTGSSGEVTEWRAAGRLDAPASLGEVLGVDEIAADTSVRIPVRLILSDPEELRPAGDVDDTLRVTADFVVSYLDPLAP